MMKLSTVFFAVSVLFLIGVSGCKKEAVAPASQAQPAAPASQAQPAAAAAQADMSLSGKVVETMNSGGYTYVSLESNGKKIWVAIPQTSVKVGQKVTCQPGMVMNNFTSKTLNRTFESIIFSGGIL
jgi:hypothetical protein